MLIIDTSTGTVLSASTCRLIHDDDLTEAEWEALDTMSDSEVCELARPRGRHVFTDTDLLSSIANALWGDDEDKPWSADTLDAIADAIRLIRPDLAPAA